MPSQVTLLSLMVAKVHPHCAVLGEDTQDPSSVKSASDITKARGPKSEWSKTVLLISKLMRLIF